MRDAQNAVARKEASFYLQRSERCYENRSFCSCATFGTLFGGQRRLFGGYYLFLDRVFCQRKDRACLY